MVSTWRSKSNEATLEAIIESLDDIKSQSSSFSVPINENGQKFATGGKGSPTGAVGGSGGNQFFPATRSKITSYDINQVDQTTLDRLNITSRLMVVTGDDPSDLYVKWIQFAKSDGQPIWLMPESGKTLHLEALGNIDIGSQVDVADTQIVELIFNTESDITADGGFTIVGLGSGGGGLNFPILYPEDDLGTVGGANITPNLAGATAHFKQVLINGDIGIATPINPPAADKFFEWWLQITQDAVGGRSISTVSAPIKNSANLDILLDKNPNAVTIFHFTTGDGGTSYHAELVDLTSGGAGGEFFGPMTANHDYGGFNITELGTLKFDIPNSEIQVNPIGMTFLTPAADNWQWFEATVGLKMELDTDSLDLRVDLDLNPNSMLAHSISGFDFLQLQNDAGASFGTITPDQSAFPGMLLTMNSNQDFIIAGTAGERFRFAPDTAPRMDIVGGLLSVFSMQTTVGDVFQILLDELNNLTSINTTNTMELKSGGNDKLFIKNTDVELWTDLDLNTFDIFDVDLHLFAPGGASLLATDVGYTSPIGGGLHANVLNLQKFNVTDELVVKMSLDMSANIAYFNDMILTVQEVSSGDVVQILASAGLASISSTQDLRVNAVMDVGSGGVTMVGTQYIANLDQLGFRNLGNFIEDDANGMRFSIIPTKDFTFTDGVTEMAVLDVDALRLNNMSIQMDSQASPGVSGFANVGYVFMDSGNSHHLSIIRNASVIDLEAGGGGEIFTWTAAHDADGFDFILTQDGFGKIQTDRDVGIPAEEIWFFVNNAGASRNVMVFDNAATEVRIVAPFNLNPSSSGTQQLGVTTDRWDSAWIDAFIDFDDSGTPATPATGEGRIYWNNTSKAFYQIDDLGATIDLTGGASSGANQQLSNLSGTVSINLDIFPAGAGLLFDGDASNYWAGIYAKRMVFPAATTLGTSEYGVGRVGTDMEFKIPTGSTYRWDIDIGDEMQLSSTLLTLQGVDLTMNNNVIFDLDQLQLTGPTGDVVFGLLTADATGITLNAQVSGDFIDFGGHNGTSVVNWLRLDAGGTPNGDLAFDATNMNSMSMNGSIIIDAGSISFDVISGTAPSINASTNDMIFNVGINDAWQWDDGGLVAYLDSVRGFEIYTPTSNIAGSLLGTDAATDVFELKVANNVDFYMTDNGGIFFQYATSTGSLRFAGSAGMQLDTDYLDINDVAANPATPGTGFARLFVFVSGGAQTLRVKFDNGTVKDIATDV